MDRSSSALHFTRTRFSTCHKHSMPALLILNSYPCILPAAVVTNGCAPLRWFLKPRAHDGHHWQEGPPDFWPGNPPEFENNLKQSKELLHKYFKNTFDIAITLDRFFSELHRNEFHKKCSNASAFGVRFEVIKLSPNYCMSKKIQICKHWVNVNWL